MVALLPERELRARGAEVVSTDRDGDAAGDAERCWLQLVAVGVRKLEGIAVLEFDAELAARFAGLEPAGGAFDVGERRFVTVLANDTAVARPRAEARQPIAAVDVVTPDEPDLRGGGCRRPSRADSSRPKPDLGVGS